MIDECALYLIRWLSVTQLEWPLARTSYVRLQIPVLPTYDRMHFLAVTTTSFSSTCLPPTTLITVILATSRSIMQPLPTMNIETEQRMTILQF